MASLRLHTDAINLAQLHQQQSSIITTINAVSASLIDLKQGHAAALTKDDVCQLLASEFDLAGLPRTLGKLNMAQYNNLHGSCNDGTVVRCKITIQFINPRYAIIVPVI